MSKINPVNSFRIPLYIIALVLIIIGPRWIFAEKPWLLDKVANEATLEMSFDELFNEPINETLPEYLRTIYKFFGLWVAFLGVFIFIQIKYLDENNGKHRKIIHSSVGILLLISLYFGHTRIPSSPFIYLMWFFVALMLLSIYASFRINK